MALSKRFLRNVFTLFLLAFIALPAFTFSALAQADIGLSTFRDSVDSVAGQTEYSYFLRVLNYGDQPAEKARLNLPLPKNLQFISVSPAKQCVFDKAKRRVECDFGALQSGEEAAKLITMVVKSTDRKTKSTILHATVSTSSLENIKTNNQQSETTSFAGGSAKGVDLGITSFEEVVSSSDDQIRSFEISVANFGDRKISDARLVVSLSDLLGFQSVKAGQNCSFDSTKGQLSCPLPDLDVTRKGGEGRSVVLNLYDRSGKSGAVKLQARVETSDHDIVVGNDLQALVVTLGARTLKAQLMAQNELKEGENAPETTAAIEDNTSVADPAVSSGAVASSASAPPAGDTSSSSNSGGSLFSQLGGLFKSLNVGPSGGDVDFQIQGFETSPIEVPAGSQFTLNTALINNGPGAANNATLDITVPQGVSFVSGPAACSHDGNPPTGVSYVNCSFGDIANGATLAIPVLFKAEIAGRIVRSFSAAIDSASNETNAANNTQSVNLTITNGADLLLGIAGAPNPATAGGNVAYTLTVTNQGLNIAQGEKVVFNLPPGIDYVAAGSGGNGWSCVAAGQVVTCTRNTDLAATNGVTSFIVNGKITGGSGSGTYTASGSVFSLVTPDVNGSNDTATFDLTVLPGTDLSVSKAVSQNPMYGGSTPFFTITVTNNGPFPAQNLVLTDTLPANFIYVAVGSGGNGWSCSAVGQLVTCTRPDLAVGASNVTINVQAPANNLIAEAGMTVINSASISSDTNDGVVANNTGSVSFVLQRDGADLAIQFVASPNPVAQGAALARDIRVKNLGPRIATGNFRITYQLTAGETITSTGGLGWSCLPVAGAPLKLTCEHAGPLGIGVTSSTLRVNSVANNAGAVVNETCTSTQTGLEPIETDPVASNNCVTRTAVSTAQIADLAVTKTVNPALLASNINQLTYQVVVNNNGPDDATNVTMTDRIPGYVDAFGSRPATGVTAVFGGTPCAVNRYQITCSLGTIANGTNKVIDITVDRPLADGAFTNLAQAWSSDIGDSNRANNLATVNLSIESVTDLQFVSGVWAPDPVKAGVDARYVLTFRNFGPSTATGVTLQSIFAGSPYTFVSATPSKGSCAPFVTGTQTLDCTIGNLANSEQQTVTVVLRPSHQDPAPLDWKITNATSVATTTTESDLTNNAGGAPLTIIPAAIDLDVTQIDLADPVSFNPTPAGLDNRITYRVRVTNRGPSYATGVTFTDSFTPPGTHRLKFICDQSANTGNCQQGDANQICNNQGSIATGPGTASTTCTIGDMAVNDTYTRYLVYEVLDTPVGGGETFQKSVVIAANENDTVPANDNAVEQTTVRVRTDVAVTCNAPPASVSIRQPYNLTYSVTNGGPGSSQTTSYSQTLPSGLKLTAQPTVTGGGSCTGAVNGTNFTCVLGTLASGGAITVTVPVRFDSYPSGGTYTTSASVSTDEVDTNTGNNSCTAVAANVVRSSLTGFVYEDRNNDGDKDGTDPAISGVAVRLTGTDVYGNNVDLGSTTDNNGFYSFYNLSPADGAGYTVTETHPATYQDGQENAGGASVVANSATSDVISAIALAAGENKVHYDFGELPTDLEVVSKTPSLATVSLRQPFDYTILVRNNGPADATSSTLADTLPNGMQLTAAPTTTVGTCSGLAGNSSFTCNFGTMVNAATVTVTVPVQILTTGNKTNTAVASTNRTEITTANNSKSGPVTVVKSRISCVVYQDFDNDGNKGVGELGIGGIAMTLKGTDDYGNVVVLAQNTGIDGSCSFDNLSPSTIGIGGGYALSETVQPVGFIDGKENNEGTIIANSGAGGANSDVMGPISLAANTYLQTHQFGEVPPTGISGTVWCDDNNDGTIDAAENRRISGVSIVLTGTETNGPAVTIPKITDGNGNYSFPDLNPGIYTVTQTQLTSHACKLPGKASGGNGATAVGTPDNGNGSASFGNVIAGIELAANDVAVSYNFGELEPVSIAGFVYNDIDDSKVQDNGEPGIGGVDLTLSCQDYRDRNVAAVTIQTQADGSFSFNDLLPTNAAGCKIVETQPSGYQDSLEIAGPKGGNIAVNDEISTIVLASGDNATGYIFAERSPTLSGHVYVDRDNDGVFDNGEVPIENVTLTLTGKDDTGADVSLIRTTDANGFYQFAGLRPSNANGYTVTQTHPVAWADGKDTAGTSGGTAAQNDVISAIVLAGADQSKNNDFGELGGSLAGTVYTDLDNDGQQDGNEAGIPGAVLTLNCTDVNAQAYGPATATTDATGNYIFKDIPATSAPHCAITEAQPANTTDGQDAVGSLGGITGNDNLSGIALTPGQAGTSYNFGEVLANPATVAGHVWHDGNHDRANNENKPQAGWTVELLHRVNPSQCSQTPTIIATQTTGADGSYRFEGVSPGTYDIQFRSPNGGVLYAGTQSGHTQNNTGDARGVIIPCGIGSVVVAAGENIVNQDLPLDPSGVVYDSLTRIPVSGATVRIIGPSGFDANLHLVGGAPNALQQTDATGYYQFLLFSNAPAGQYSLILGQPTGYIPQPSAIIPVCNTALSVSQFPTPALVQNSDTAPTTSVATHNAASCPATSAGLAGGANSTQYYFDFDLNPGLPSGNVVNNHLPVDPVTEGALTVSKTTPKINVSIGNLVPYTITVNNNLAATLPNMEIEDQIPPGFKYRVGSATLDGVRIEPVISGRRLTWPALTFTPNQKRVVKLLMIVGGGVSEGEYINKAWAENGFVQALASNVASAKVRVTADPLFDCAGVIGKVFDDKNRNGYQDKGEPGLANVRLATVRGLLVTTDKYGRYHVACAAIPDQDRGSNFIMKLDDRTLPGGYRLTTENPRMIRLTRGKIGKLNFGVAIHRIVRLDITRDAFTARGDDLKGAWRKGIPRLVRVLDRGPSILRIAYAKRPGESSRTVRKRINIIKRQVTRLWRRKRRPALTIESESYVSATHSFK